MSVHNHLDINNELDHFQAWSVGDEESVRVSVGNYDSDGYTLAMAGFVMSAEETLELYDALRAHLVRTGRLDK